VTRFSTYVAPPWVRFGFVAIWGLVLLYASVSDPSGAGLSRTGPFGVLGLDKWLHAAGYAAFAVLVAYAFLPRWRGTRRGLIASLLLAGGYGLAMEVVQGPLAYRSFDPADAVANLFGALVVVLAVGLGSRVLERRSRRSRPEPGRGR